MWNPITLFIGSRGEGRDATNPPFLIFENIGDALVLTGMLDERKKRAVFVFGVNEGYSFS